MEIKEKAELLELSLQRTMGKVLDLGRISGMSDRSFQQFERTIKIEVNGMIRLLKQELFDISSDGANK